MAPIASAVSQPLISVIIPTWNRRNLVLDAVHSAQEQTWTNTQIIVVDDGSTDGTADLLATCPRITYLCQSHKGQAAARNLGLRYAEGDYVASLDSDDTWRPGFLETCLRGLLQLGADFVFANWVKQGFDGRRSSSHLERDGRWKRYSKPVVPGWYTLGASESRLLFIENCPSPSSALLFRRQPFRHGWNEQMRICDDWCLQLDSVIDQPSHVAFTMEPLWVKRARPDSICDGLDPRGTMVDDWFSDVQTMRQRFAGRLTEAEHAIMGRHELQWRLSAGRRRLLRPGQRSAAVGLIASSFLADPAYALRTTGSWVRYRMSLLAGSR
ncbi:MAG: glycosyltransferase family 2 protein [Anaerolineae bacterium]